MRSAAARFNWPASTIAVLDDLEHFRRVCEEVVLANVGGAAVLKVGTCSSLSSQTIQFTLISPLTLNTNRSGSSSHKMES